MLTYLISVGNSTPVALPVLTQGTITGMWVQEDPSVANWPTTDFFLMGPGNNNTATAARKVSGTGWPIPLVQTGANFGKGSNMGWLQTVSGNTNFQVIEYP
jgi:hypothetical protein